MTAVGTSASQILQYVVERSFVLEADPGNSAPIQISSVDPTVTTSFVTLKAGQQEPFENWTGTLWALSTASTKVYIEFMDGKGKALGKFGP